MINRRVLGALGVSLLLLFATGCAGASDLPASDVIATRPPPPTAEPTFIEETVEEMAANAGVADASFLGLDIVQWTDIGAALLFVVVGYLIGRWLIGLAFAWLGRLTSPEFGQLARARTEKTSRWLLLVLLAYVGVIRVSILDPWLRRTILDVLFVIGVLLVVVLLWYAIDLALVWYRQQQGDAERLEEIDPVLTLLTRIGRIILVIGGAAWMLNHFGINITALAAALGVGGLAISLAAQDTISDFIAGVIILFDRPFRVGDRIEIQNLGTWGDVTEIGLRTTRIRTRDNRMVIVPNSIIGSSQVVNYTYPDPRYRIELHIIIQYGTDIEFVRQLIIDTVSEVPGVLKDKPVDALYVDMGEYGMVFRVRWWIESYADTRRMFDKVNTALQATLDANGIRSPYPTQAILLEQGPDLPTPPSGAAATPVVEEDNETPPDA